MKKNKLQAAIELPEDWKQRFKSSSIKVGFQLNLSRAMLEFLCAVADDCQWDRATFGELHYPDNWIATEGSLEKRGLIQRKDGPAREAAAKHNSDEINAAWKDGRDKSDCTYRNYCRLTPAGAKVVELLKVSGLFVAADASLRRKRA
jgi:hypothetical protein